jgi:hypothetical protein
MELKLHCPICLHGKLFNYLNIRKTLTFTCSFACFGKTGKESRLEIEFSGMSVIIFVFLSRKQHPANHHLIF